MNKNKKSDSVDMSYESIISKFDKKKRRLSRKIKRLLGL
jgi:hypothetical protein